MKHLLTILCVAGTMMLVSCGNTENEQLKKRIAELEAQIKTDQAESQQALNSMDLSPISNDDLSAFLGAFNASGNQNVKVPISWQMEKSTLSTILNKSDAAGHETVGIMIYPMKEKEYLKLAVIPYYVDGDKMKHFNLDELGAYNYSNMCPPGTNCAASNGDFGAATEESVWGKQ